MGNFLANLTNRICLFILKHKVLYYLLNITWGLLATTVGIISTLVLLCFGIKPKRYGHTWYTPIGEHWGGLELGLCFIVDKSESKATLRHEYGHTAQNAVWGPLFPFIISIPSAIRYHLRNRKTMRAKYAFSAILGAVSIVVGISFCFIPVVGKVLGAAVLAYFTIINAWLLLYEIPQYETRNVPYDAVWFERSATYIGKHADM